MLFDVEGVRFRAAKIAQDGPFRAVGDFWSMSARLTSPLFARLATISLALLPALALAQPIQTWRLGPDTDTQATPLGGIVLSGGAGEVDPAMQWFLQRAGGGDVLILRVSGSDGYQNYFYNELGVDVASVETIKFTAPSAASADYVTQRIAEAEAIWLAGGDQSNYVDYWQGTPVEDGLHALVARGGALGGISAGMAVLGGGYFAAGNGTVYSDEALADPYDEDVDVRHGDFLELPHLSNTITDTHFDDPDRRGRLFTFLARLSVDHGVQLPRAIACEEYTAVGIQPDGLARVWGEWPDYGDYAYFVRPGCTELMSGSGPVPDLCIAGQPLTWGLSPAAAGDDDGQGGLIAAKVPGGYNGPIAFDLNSWLPVDDAEWKRWTADGEGGFHTGPLPPAEAPEAVTGCGLDLTGVAPPLSDTGSAAALALLRSRPDHWLLQSHHPEPVEGALYTSAGRLIGRPMIEPGTQPLPRPTGVRGTLLLRVGTDALHLPSLR